MQDGAYPNFPWNCGKKLISKLSEKVITSILNLSIFREDASIELVDIVRTYFLMNMEQSTHFEKKSHCLVLLTTMCIMLHVSNPDI